MYFCITRLRNWTFNQHNELITHTHATHTQHKTHIPGTTPCYSNKCTLVRHLWKMSSVPELFQTTESNQQLPFVDSSLRHFLPQWFVVWPMAVFVFSGKRDHHCDCAIWSLYKHLPLLSNHWVKHSLSFTLLKRCYLLRFLSPACSNYRTIVGHGTIVLIVMVLE